MSERVTKELPNYLLSVLQNGTPAILVSIGDDGYPNTAFTWLVALSSTTLRFGVDHGTATLENLKRRKSPALQVIAPGNLVYIIKGNVRQLKERMKAAPFKVGMWEMEVEEVKDQSWPGVKVHPLGYEWEPDQREEMIAMERAVYEEMRQWSG